MNGFSTPILIAIAVAALFVVLLILGYLKAPPDTAYIISGLGKKADSDRPCRLARAVFRAG